VFYPRDDVAAEEVQKCSSWRNLPAGKSTLLLREGNLKKKF